MPRWPDSVISVQSVQTGAGTQKRFKHGGFRMHKPEVHLS